MIRTPITLAFAALASAVVVGAASAQTAQTGADAQYQAQQEDYQAKKEANQAQQDQYALRRETYEARKAAYDAELQAYEARCAAYMDKMEDYDFLHGKGAYTRTYGPAPLPPAPLPSFDAAVAGY